MKGEHASVDLLCHCTAYISVLFEHCSTAIIASFPSSTAQPKNSWAVEPGKEAIYCLQTAAAISFNELSFSLLSTVNTTRPVTADAADVLRKLQFGSI